MASIKRSELEKLKADEAYYRSQWSILNDEANVLARFAVGAAEKVEDLRDKLWTAEQEIHDLKEYVEKCDNLRFEVEYVRDVYKNECVELINEYVDECSQHDKLKDLYEDLLSVQRVDGLKIEESDNAPCDIVRNTPQTSDKIIRDDGVVLKGTVDAGPASWSAETYYAKEAPPFTGMNWTEKSCEPLESALLPVRKNPLKKHFSRIAISLLLLTVLGLGLVSFRQNQVIQYQREVLREAAEYILHVCPPAAPSSLSQAHQ